MTRCLSLALIAAVTTSAGAQAKPGPIKPAELMRHLAVLAHDSLEGRAVGTPGGAKARAYMLKALKDAGLQQLGTTFEYPFAVRGRDTTQPPRNGVNIVGVIRGRTNPERYIVLSAHYDHVGVRQGEVFNGADDNASGASSLVELTRQLAKSRPANSIIIAAFDGEESGLRGARAFVAEPPVPLASIVMNVNLDMVGRNAKGELYASGATPYPFLRPYLEELVPRSTIKLLLGHDDPATGRDNWTNQSDQGAFNNAKIPFVYFGVEDHPDYHKATDEIAGIMPEFYAGAVNTVLDAIRTFDTNLAVIVSKSPAR